jgi:hypothetical protein
MNAYLFSQEQQMERRTFAEIRRIEGGQHDGRARPDGRQAVPFGALAAMPR